MQEKPNRSDRDQALATLLETAGRFNVGFNCEKLQYKKDEVDFFSETYTTIGQKTDQSKVSVITKMPAPTIRSKYSLL